MFKLVILYLRSTKIIKKKNMRKFILSFCALVFTTISFAQEKMVYSPNDFLTNRVLDASSYIPSVTSSSSSLISNVIWSDNFSSDTNWVLDHDASSCALDWQIGIVSNTGDYPTADILSTSAADGYAMLDSDAYGSEAGTEMEDSWLTMAYPVDLNGYPDVVVQFETHYRAFNNEKPYIVVGIGDGMGNVTWPSLDANSAGTVQTPVALPSNVFEPFPEWAVGESTENPELITVDISSALVGLTQVQLADIYIRFNWTGTWGYSWFVDDFAIAVTPDNSISMSDEVIGGFWMDYMNYPAEGLNDMIGLDYSITPISQLANHPFSFEASIKNIGLSTQHIKLKYNVTGVGSAYGESVNVILNSQEDSLIAAVPTFGGSATSLGNYSVEIFAEADSAGAGITITTLPAVTKAFEVSNYIYAKDDGNTDPGAYILGGQIDQNHITTRYEMYANEQLYSVRAYIDDRSVVGAEIKGIIYEVDTTAAADVLFLAETDDYEITAQDLGAWIDLPFLAPLPQLFDGFAYELGVVGFQHPTDSSFVGASGPSLYNGEHSSFDELGLSEQSEGAPTWYYITSAPMIRMNFDPASLSVSDIKQSIFTVYPNPSNGVFTISIDNNDIYDVKVSNVLGQTVYTSRTSAMQTNIDLSSFDKGVYTIELKKGSKIVADKIVLD
jgi:hypothetical protein